jgi:hypothetical protein
MLRTLKLSLHQKGGGVPYISFSAGSLVATSPVIVSMTIDLILRSSKAMQQAAGRTINYL